MCSFSNFCELKKLFHTRPNSIRSRQPFALFSSSLPRSISNLSPFLPISFPVLSSFLITCLYSAQHLIAPNLRNIHLPNTDNWIECNYSDRHQATLRNWWLRCEGIRSSNVARYLPHENCSRKCLSFWNGGKLALARNIYFQICISRSMGFDSIPARFLFHSFHLFSRCTGV